MISKVEQVSIINIHIVNLYSKHSERYFSLLLTYLKNKCLITAMFFFTFRSTPLIGSKRSLAMEQCLTCFGLIPMVYIHRSRRLSI